jgi:DNA-binding transcriptional MerR regulator
MAKKLTPLDVAELEQVKALRASGLSFHAISKRLDRDPKTIKKACLDPDMATQIERVKGDLADRFEDLAKRMVASISDEDITRINAYQRTVSAAVSTDKMRLLRGHSTENISLHAIIERIEREEREQPARERQKEVAQRGEE